MKYIWSQLCVWRETWLGGAYGSYRTKNVREDRVLGYDALASDDVFMFISSLWGMWNK